MWRVAVKVNIKMISNGFPKWFHAGKSTRGNRLFKYHSSYLL